MSNNFARAEIFPAPDGKDLRQNGKRVLTGWGGGKAEDVIPKAADIGFKELVVHHEDATNFAKFIALGRDHDIAIYAWIFLGDLPAWKKAYSDAEAPLQVMTSAEQEASARLRADKSPDRAGYQFGGEPLNAVEVLTTPLLCFHDPRVIETFKRQIDEILAVTGVCGVAFDYFGYQNYRRCLCPVSQAQLKDYRIKHPELSRESAEERFSLETLVDFNNRLADYARQVRPDTKVINHVYPVYLPEPLYGNRLDLDVCGQTAAWFFKPFWSVEKIKAYSRVISEQANRYYPRPRGAALIGYENPAGKSAGKNPERVESELKAIFEGGCSRVHVCSMNDVIDDPGVAAVFKKYFQESNGNTNRPGIISPDDKK